VEPSGKASEVRFAQVFGAGAELSFGVRLRIALDVLAHVVDEDESAPLVRRDATSRLRIENIVISDEGTAAAVGEGSNAGAAELVWEILSERFFEGDSPAPLRDIADDVTVDVAELIDRAVSQGGELSRIEELGRDPGGSR
jgi:hypothetical protein